MKFSVDIILASASPRRRQLLDQSGLSFSVVPANIDETIPPGTVPEEAVASLAAAKAQSIATAHPNSLVIGSDTIVVLDNLILEKPESTDHAVEMLQALSGRTHTVYTGIALRSVVHNVSVAEVVSTDVTMDTISLSDIRSYVATGATMDKAGSYGIQDRGAFFVKEIRGDFYSVMGFPLNRFYRLVQEHCQPILTEDEVSTDLKEVRYE